MLHIVKHCLFQVPACYERSLKKSVGSTIFKITVKILQPFILGENLDIKFIFNFPVPGLERGKKKTVFHTKNSACFCLGHHLCTVNADFHSSGTGRNWRWVSHWRWVGCNAEDCSVQLPEPIRAPWPSPFTSRSLARPRGRFYTAGSWNEARWTKLHFGPIIYIKLWSSSN